jgi:hypothetical protein
VSNREIRDFRRDTGQTFPDTWTVYRPPDPATATRKPSGAIDDTYPTQWTVVETNARCRIAESRLSGVERAGAGKPQATASYDVHVLWNAVIDETCRARVTASPNNPQLVGVDFDVKEAPLTTNPAERIIQATRTT